MLYRCPTGGLLVSFFCNQFGGHYWDLVDERDLPQDFVRLVGGEYEFVFGVEGHPIVERVEQTPRQDAVTTDTGDSLIGTSSDGDNDTRALGIVGDDPSLDGEAKRVGHSLISLENVKCGGTGEMEARIQEGRYRRLPLASCSLRLHCLVRVALYDSDSQSEQALKKIFGNSLCAALS